MAPPELSPSAFGPDTTLPGPGLAGSALGGLFFLVALVALVCFGYALSNAAQAADLTGTAGTLTVQDENAGVRAALTPGSKVAVQRSGNSYVRTGFGEVTRWISVFFGGLIVVAIGADRSAAPGWARCASGCSRAAWRPPRCASS